MRILHILGHTRRRNGNVHAAIDLACAQAKRGHQVRIAHGGGDFETLLAHNKVISVSIDQRRRPVTLLKALLALRTQMDEFQPDIVHAHMMTSAVLAFPICRLSGKPLVTTVHNAFERSATLMGLGARVIAVSDAVSASMQRRGIAGAKLRTVLNGTIGSARFEGRGCSPAELSHPNILFVGGMHPRKGLPDLLEAFRLLSDTYPEAHLYVAGGGPFKTAYQQLAADTGCGDKITFVGGVDEPLPFMKGADIFVLPSHADPAPLVLSEAREAGCAVVGTNVDGIPQLLDFGKAGLIVPPGDPKALAEVLGTLLGDRGQLRHWRERSQSNIGRLTIERVAAETEDVYYSALGQPSKSATIA
ncbi:glycosyl transferase group 1 [Rhizobium sp. CF080]|uniref:glycosyltransferase family 4 protein n=1 Tax=Rhizobium sp. (strain CF080) TaxID=1144310 RepID=UPI000271563C|nr:glycosyltransferase family 4 protein [Rhizobium sp. CF080]EUB99552.1 glycosyl transferase group 1 [Rhizobium sp. CF080]